MYPRQIDEDPRRISAPAAGLAVAGAVAAAASLVTLHILNPEYSPAWRLVSEYANGRYAWVLSLMFAAYGISSLALAFAIRRQPRTKSGRIGLAALISAGIGQAAAAIFNLNQVALHEVAGAVGIIGLPIGAVLISRSLVHQASWSPASKPIVWLAHLTWISVLLWVATFILMVVTFMQALGTLPSAPPKDLPPGVIAVVGWTDRLLIVSAWAWVAMVATHAIRIRRAAAPDRLERSERASDRQPALSQ